MNSVFLSFSMLRHAILFWRIFLYHRKWGSWTRKNWSNALTCLYLRFSGWLLDARGAAVAPAAATYMDTTRRRRAACAYGLARTWMGPAHRPTTCAGTEGTPVGTGATGNQSPSPCECPSSASPSTNRCATPPLGTTRMEGYLKVVWCPTALGGPNTWHADIFCVFTTHPTGTDCAPILALGCWRPPGVATPSSFSHSPAS